MLNGAVIAESTLTGPVWPAFCPPALAPRLPISRRWTKIAIAGAAFTRRIA